MSHGADTPVFNPVVDAALISRVEQFLFREARLLDERKAQQWLALVAEDINYLVPSRHVPTPDPELRGSEAFHDRAQELETAGVDGCPIRDENFFNLAIRVDRMFKVNAWAENPPARTRRYLSNIEVAARPDGNFEVYSNFQLFYSRHQQDNFTYYGQRQDILRPEGDSFKLARREVILDFNVITVPTLGLIF
jgi:3-phenylpropionate/cinnamic acid dioxygenase small subunit